MVFVSMVELLSEAGVKDLLKLYSEHKLDGRFVDLCSQRIIKPRLQVINRATNQENDPVYLAYLLEYTLMALEGRQKTTVA